MMVRVVVCFFVILEAALAVNLLEDVVEDSVEEKECYGTSVKFGHSGSPEFHYNNNLRRRYEGCTYVHGNLEITNLEDPAIDYDLSFLRHIRYVEGYVLIGLVSGVPVISFPSLQVVRGNKTLPLFGDNFSFVVVLTARADLTSGLTELHLPELREISSGKVLFFENPLLCRVELQQPWASLLPGRLSASSSLRLDRQAAQCERCTCGRGADTCWGLNTDVCRPAPPTQCHETCPHRCFAPGTEGCCSDKCAVGCSGPLDSDCLMCKDYQMEGRCLSHCPPKSYSYFQECISYA